MMIAFVLFRRPRKTLQSDRKPAVMKHPKTEAAIVP